MVVALREVETVASSVSGEAVVESAVEPEVSADEVSLAVEDELSETEREVFTEDLSAESAEASFLSIRHEDKKIAPIITIISTIVALTRDLFNFNLTILYLKAQVPGNYRKISVNAA